MCSIAEHLPSDMWHVLIMTGAAESFDLDFQNYGGAYGSVKEWKTQNMVERQHNRAQVIYKYFLPFILLRFLAPDSPCHVDQHFIKSINQSINQSINNLKCDPDSR